MGSESHLVIARREIDVETLGWTLVGFKQRMRSDGEIQLIADGANSNFEAFEPSGGLADFLFGSRVFMASAQGP